MHAVTTHLTGSVSTEEDHVLETIHAHRAARLEHTRANYSIMHGTSVRLYLLPNTSEDRMAEM